MDPPGPSPSAKRRKLEELAAGESPPRATQATEAANPRPTTPIQERPQPDAGGEEGGVDRISVLPDDLLGEIISLLSTKEAARTQILASRWHRVWRAAPLVLDSNDLAAKAFPTGSWTRASVAEADEALASAVSHILSTHLGPGRRFCVLPHFLHYRAASVDAWLRSPALDNLQELEFARNRYNWHRYFVLAPPPASAFRFSDTLRVATFRNCMILDGSIDGLHFPNLKQLALELVRIAEDSLQTMIYSCPVLECLMLNQSFGFSCLRISSSSLRSISVTNYIGGKLQEVSIVDAPCLERLLFNHLHHPCARTNVSVISAPKLETLGCLSDVYEPIRVIRLVIGTTAIEGSRVINMTTVVHSVKILATRSSDISLDMVIELLKCFPCMEKLYIKSHIQGTNRWRRKHRKFIEGFDIRLKTIVLEQYQGIRSQVNFVTFFLLNARELELMTLVVKEGADNEAFSAQQHNVLKMEKRASRDARLHFTTESCHHYIHVNHVRDLAINDPFECSSQNC